MSLGDREPRIETYIFEDDGRIPNNPELPLLFYRRGLEDSASTECKELFRENRWGGTWTNGVFSYHHYHSTAHEVLGVVRGEARITFGGESGVTVGVEAGDAVVIPAGVGHRNVGSSGDFTVVGAYPRGQSWDLRTGAEGERPRVLENIRNVPLPEMDPLFGEQGPLVEHWQM